VSAGAQCFGHSDAGEKMSTGSATCDYCIHEKRLSIFR
jgi:hypothetical protein